MYSRYTLEQDNLIKHYAGKKYSEDIGAMFGKSGASVRIRAKRLGVSISVTGENHRDAILSNLQTEMAQALFTCGFKVSEIHKACFSHVGYDCIRAKIK